MKTCLKSFDTPFLIVLISLFIITGCSVKWTKAIHYGTIAQKDFEESVVLEVHKGLIIVPVTIRGKSYRFLFDTGAPFSISEELQNEFNFKVISKGHIIDSDHNRKAVNWARIDSIHVGQILFLGQSAFVGDFTSNPILECLKIDGIIGSNLMRHCSWTIDQTNNNLTLSDRNNKLKPSGYTVLPFRTDRQYSMFVDLTIGQATTNHILVDYGSNGSMTLSNEIFKFLKDREIIQGTFIEKGIKQSGMIGNPVPVNRELVFTDSVFLGGLSLDHVLVQTGKTVAIGNKILSRYKVTIDWSSQNLFLYPQDFDIQKSGLPGFRLGYTKEQGVYVLSVIENSHADKAGIKPNMTITRIGSLDFEKNADFCDYVNYELKNSIYIQAIDSIGNKNDFNFEKTYF